MIFTNVLKYVSTPCLRDLGGKAGHVLCHVLFYETLRTVENYINLMFDHGQMVAIFDFTQTAEYLK